MHDVLDLTRQEYHYSSVHGRDQVLEDIEGLEMFTLRSVGIDIGSSTTHLIFSLLTLRREGTSLSAQFKVTERKVLYQSKIMLTPYFSETLIDTDMDIDVGGGTSKLSLPA